MRTVLILVLGCLPLAVLTLRSLAAAVTGSAVAPLETSSETDDAEVAARAAQTARTSAELQTYLTRVSQLQFLSPSPLPAVLPAVPQEAGAGERVKELAEHLPAAQRAQAGALHSLSVLAGRRAADLKPEEMQAIAASRQLNGLLGGEALQRRWSRRAGEIEKDQEILNRVKNARQFLARSEFASCLKELEGIDERGEAPALVQEIQELRRRSEFWKSWKVAWTRSSPAANALERRTRLAEIRRRKEPAESGVAVPSATLDDERSYLAWLDSEERRLSDDLALDTFLEHPPETARQFIQQAEVLLAKNPGRKSELSREFRKWAEAQFPARPAASAGARVQEAFRNDGTLLVGIFDQQGFGTKPWYWYYKSIEDFRRKTGRVQVYQDELKAPPAVPTPARSRQEYNAERTRLFANFASETAWRKFAAKCRELDQVLEDYRQHATALPTTDTFEAEAGVSEAVLNQWQFVDALYAD